MSERYRGLEEIMFSDVFDGRLEEYGIREYVTEQPTAGRRCLTDGDEYLWVHEVDGGAADFVRRSLRAPFEIFDVIGECFGTELISENDPRYYGAATWDEVYKPKRRG